MVMWIVLAVVLLRLVVLALAVRPVLARLPRLRRAAVALQRRAGRGARRCGTAAEALQAAGRGAPASGSTPQERLADQGRARGDRGPRRRADRAVAQTAPSRG